MAVAPVVIEQRKYGVRRDINDLVRDESGKISGAKIGTYVGQGIAAKLLLVTAPLPTWDVLAILFTVLIMPEMLKKLLIVKYGGTPDISPQLPNTTITNTATQTQSRTVKK